MSYKMTSEKFDNKDDDGFIFNVTSENEIASGAGGKNPDYVPTTLFDLDFSDDDMFQG